MEYIELIAPCHFGLESVLRKEIDDLGYDVKQVEDGKVTFLGDWESVCYANIFLRTAERILVKVGSFRAVTYDELFEGTKAIAWEDYIPSDGKFWVAKAASIKSALFSPSDIQSIVKKAMVERMKQVYHTSWFQETGESFPLRVTIMKDEVTIGLDTTGISLHKRGYRKLTARAPISETLASALISLTPWRPGRILVDPFCGSGTFLIEAAMMSAGMAPGMKRSFTACNWEHLISRAEWKNVYEDAKTQVDLAALSERSGDLQGYDIDPEVLKLARENARLAGVDAMIHFQQRDIMDLSHPKKYGFVITNPPYGERLEEKDHLEEIYKDFGAAMKKLDTWSFYLITSYDRAEACIGKKAAKNRKIYNGMLKTYFYQYPGPKPRQISKQNR